MITLAAANATGATLLVLDDPSVDADQGTAFSASFTPAAFDMGLASGFGTLRRLIQTIAISGPVSVAITPVGDGAEYTSQAVSFTLATEDGAEQEIEAPVWVPATRFQFRVNVTNHEGITEFGESDQWFVVRRERRST
jgi:hypothetical protein